MARHKRIEKDHVYGFHDRSRKDFSPNYLLLSQSEAWNG